MNCFDKLGQLLLAGDYIVYGHALGRSAGLKIGRILEIKGEEVEDRPWGWHPPLLTRFKIEWRIRVAGIYDHWGIVRPEVSRGTCQYPDRMCRVREEDLPAEVWKILREVVP